MWTVNRWTYADRKRFRLGRKWGTADRKCLRSYRTAERKQITNHSEGIRIGIYRYRQVSDAVDADVVFVGARVRRKRENAVRWLAWSRRSLGSRRGWSCGRGHDCSLRSRGAYKRIGSHFSNGSEQEINSELTQAGGSFRKNAQVDGRIENGIARAGLGEECQNRISFCFVFCNTNGFFMSYRWIRNAADTDDVVGAAFAGNREAAVTATDERTGRRGLRGRRICWRCRRSSSCGSSSCGSSSCGSSSGGSSSGGV